MSINVFSWYIKEAIALTFFKAVKKISTREKINGYYESSYLLTRKEKESIIISLFIIMVPFLISLIIIGVN